jgi:hypothetical protein
VQNSAKHEEMNAGKELLSNLSSEDYIGVKRLLRLAVIS